MNIFAGVKNLICAFILFNESILRKLYSFLQHTTWDIRKTVGMRSKSVIRTQMKQTKPTGSNRSFGILGNLDSLK